jgi:phage head maturation protease
MGVCSYHDVMVHAYGLCNDFEASVKRQVPAASSPIKSLGSYKYRGYGVVFNGQDLVGETFHPNTDFGISRDFKGMDVLYDHALGGIKSAIGKVTDWKIEDDGIIFEFELDKHHRYVEEVSRLIESGAAGLSTGTSKHTVVKSGQDIVRWTISELSVTGTPMEPRTLGLSPIKSTLELMAAKAAEIGDQLKLIEERLNLN